MSIRTERKKSMERENLWKSFTKEEEKTLEDLCLSYRTCLTEAKTERLFVRYAVEALQKAGFHDLTTFSKIQTGDRFYATYMGKTLLAGIAGKQALQEGANILGAHIDSPRLDIKQNPLYEKSELAYLDTHYYGGIKKYQWVALPMAIYGVVAKKDGSLIDIAIGDQAGDPVFCVTDILIHLADRQMNKKAGSAVEGEALDILIGGRPLADVPDDKKKEAVKENILALLKEKYDMTEEDFLSAELEVVPAGPAMDLGLDRSMVIGYGQDDRVCAYTSLRALTDLGNPDRTALLILTDKEEIGSVGASGAHSRFFEDTLAELLTKAGSDTDLSLRRALRGSFMLSSDVSAGFDPAYEDCFEAKNAAYLGRGICYNKYTGARGKSGSNDANAEYMAKIRRVMDENRVGYQTSELGKVDEGGGGTIAYILANYGMNVIDSGVPVLNMHAPWEITSKADIYAAYLAYQAFLKDMK